MQKRLANNSRASADAEAFLFSVLSPRYIYLEH